MSITIGKIFYQPRPPAILTRPRSYMPPGWVMLAEAFERLVRERYGDAMTGGEATAGEVEHTCIPAEEDAIGIFGDGLIGPRRPVLPSMNAASRALLGRDYDPSDMEGYQSKRFFVRMPSVGMLFVATREEAHAVWLEECQALKTARETEIQERARAEAIRLDFQNQVYHGAITIILLDPKSGDPRVLDRPAVLSERMSDILDMSRRCRYEKPLNEFEGRFIVVEFTGAVSVVAETRRGPVRKVASQHQISEWLKVQEATTPKRCTNEEDWHRAFKSDHRELDCSKRLFKSCFKAGPFYRGTPGKPPSR